MPERSRWILLLGLLASQFAPGAMSQTGLAWKSFPDHRRADLAPAASPGPGFSPLDAGVTGIDFTNRLDDERSLTNQVFLNGSGVAAGDVDGDGLCDLYFCGLDAPNVLYRNRGDWHFGVSQGSAAVACPDQASTGAAFADVDGDGDLDLFVNGIARGTRLFLNEGRGTFVETTARADLQSASGSSSLAIADVDGDGRLDVYVVNYRSDTMRDMPGLAFTVGITNGVRTLLSVNGRPANAPDLLGRFSLDAAGGILENGEADVLFRNLGDGRFAPVPWTLGAFLDESGKPVAIPYDWGLSAICRDLDGDGAPDLYVCNDFQSPDRIWINDGKGNFRAISRLAIRQTGLFSMGVDIADLDRDGYDDLFVADMLSPTHARRQVQVLEPGAFAQFRQSTSDHPQSPRNTLFHSRGDGTYAEIARMAGLDASEWTWSPIFLDVDLDGYEDLLVTTGHWRDAMNVDVARELDAALRQRALPPREQLRLRRRFPRLETPNLAFRNRGDLTFEDHGSAWGFDSRRVSQGMALADLDNDGDLDVVVNCLNDGPLVYRNDGDRPRIAVQLRGLPPNTHGIGARISVRSPGLPSQSQEMIAGGRYLSGDQARRTFAVAAASATATVDVRWRSGRRSWLTGIPANQLVEIDESRSPPAADPPPGPPKAPLFEEVSDRLRHLHVDEPFDDFAVQPLLPHKLSDLGPGVAWFDFNGDGWDDLLIGAGRGGRLGVFRNDGKGGFIAQRASLLQTPVDRDLTTVLGWHPARTNVALLLGLSQDDGSDGNAPAVRRISLVTGRVDDDLVRSPHRCGPLTLGDVEGDGDLDLFVGGRVVNGRYPEAASSLLCRNENGQLRVDTAASEALAGIGMVSGATFSDLDGDGRPELVIACEWGPLRIFRWHTDRFEEWIPKLTQVAGRKVPPTLAGLTGWWSSVAVGDFDNDGRLDLVAGNLGRNTSRQRFLADAIRLSFGGADGPGGIALLETHLDPLLAARVPAHPLGILAPSFPSLSRHFPTHAAFGAASLGDVLQADLPPMKEVSAAESASVLLLNREEGFEIRPLPADAQCAPVFGIAPGDFDGDGNLDLLLAQNQFGVHPSESRYDAGVGLVLMGNGSGGFSTLASRESGLAIWGEGRGAATCDFDHDGRLDVAVGQHRGATLLYRNSRGHPGLRLRLRGRSGNPDAIGATVRLHLRDGRPMPVSEVRLGGGYWSQDSTELILGMPSVPESLEIHWPGGRTERISVPDGATAIVRSEDSQD